MARILFNMKITEVICLLSLFLINIEASTHWMVTESGLIQPKEESPFEMENPYDLLAFLSQDTRWENIISLYYDLAKRQVTAAELWSDLQKNSDITSFVLNDENCKKIEQLSYIDWYLSFMDEGKNKRIPKKDYLLQKPSYGQDVDVPDCKRISSLTFSMFAFEHLEGMMQRENLTGKPEMALPGLISPIMSVDQFGHWLSVCLKRNSSSWLHYNLASIYWRVKGNSPKAMECSRRALHYAPREFKDIALLSLGTILHRSKKTEDAIMVLGSAVDHNPQSHMNHFVLSTAFAVLGEYNSSIRHLDICMELDPTFELAQRYKLAVMCHNSLFHKLNGIRKITNELREELIEYAGKESQWLKQQSAFLRTMKHDGTDDDFRNVIKNAERMSELSGLKMKDLKKEGDRYSVIQYFLDGPVSISEKLQDVGVLALDSAFSLQRLVKHIEKHANMASKYVQPDLSKLMDAEVLKEIEGPAPESSFLFPDFNADSMNDFKKRWTEIKTTHKSKETNNNKAFSEYFNGHILYPTTMKVNRHLEDFDRDSVWPSHRLCKESSPSLPRNLEAIFPVFLPFENKGIRLKKLLSDKIGVPLKEEHELPWYPPLCPTQKEASVFTNKKAKQNVNNKVVQTGYLRQKLLEYASDGEAEAVLHMQDVEIGHRIYVAMQQKLAPDWIMYTLSSLYWRVRGNNNNAMHCLKAAEKRADPNYVDIVYGSLASLFLEMGYFEESLAATEEGFKLGVYEPALNFVLSELNMIRKHRNTHIFHLKQVLRVEPRFMGGLARYLLIGWACVFKQMTSLSELDTGDETCTEIEPGVNMVCSKDGSNCHVTNIECPKEMRKERSTLVRLLELQNKAPRETSAFDMDDSMFDAFKANMPADRTNKLAHQQNYDMMLRGTTALQGCGPLGCGNIKASDLGLDEEICAYQYLELSYWLQTISFKQVIIDCNKRLPSLIASAPMSKLGVPDCRMPNNLLDDFLIDRISKVDITEWEAQLGIMHQFAEVFEYYDYITLGSKIANYLELKPNSWDALIAAGFWCGAGGRAVCCLRCFAAAVANAPATHLAHPVRALAVMLHLQNKRVAAKDISYLAFYLSQNNKIDALLVASAHTYLREYEQAVWMFRYALTFDPNFVAAKACLHATMCIMLYGELNGVEGFDPKIKFGP